MVFQSIVTQLKPLTAARESSQIKQLFRSESPLLLSGVASLFIAALFSRIYADDIFGTSYESIEVVLPVGILIGVPSGIVAITSAFLASAGHERRVSILTTSWVFLMLSCLAAFTFMFGILGAILTMFALNVALAVIFLFMSAKVWKKEFI
jgi:O-antigen/teichoic acid export membrane protein